MTVGQQNCIDLMVHSCKHNYLNKRAKLSLLNDCLPSSPHIFDLHILFLKTNVCSDVMSVAYVKNAFIIEYDSYTLNIFIKRESFEEM